MNLFCKFGWHRWVSGWNPHRNGGHYPFLRCARCGREQIWEGFSNHFRGWFDRCYCQEEVDPHSVARFHNSDYVR